MEIESIVNYLDETGKTQVDFSAELEVHHVYLNAVIKGRRKASPLLARKMERISDGKIQAKSVRPDIFQ